MADRRPRCIFLHDGLAVMASGSGLFRNDGISAVVGFETTFGDLDLPVDAIPLADEGIQLFGLLVDLGLKVGGAHVRPYTAKA
jgi:hypothetical protein